MYGLTGKILIVDLTKQSLNVEIIPEEIYRKYYGGYGLGAYYIYKHITPGCDPLGPDNILGFIPGLLTGSVAPLTGRFMVCGKSPLTGRGLRSNGKECTGGWGNSNSGGTFGPSIRKAGFDAIFFTGKAPTPVYLLLDETCMSLESAEDLWGTDCVEIETILKTRHGKGVKISSIGPAGENLSLVAGIVNDKGRIAARSGLGSVMGSKNLKALCIKGNSKVKFASKPRMLELAKEYNKAIKASLDAEIPKDLIPSFAELGTTDINVESSQNGDSPVKNLKGVGIVDYPEDMAMKFRGEALKSYVKRPYGCFSCPVRCGAILEYENLPYEEKETHRPEYETCSAFGSLILNDNIDVLLQVNEYLNRMCMDSISAGNLVAYVHECVENGVFTQNDFVCHEYPEGFLPSWGESKCIMPLLKLIVSREGIGDKLADGLYQAKKYFPETAEYAITANGQNLPMHDLRLYPSLGLTYLTDPTPGRHTAGSLSSQESLKNFIEGIEFENSEDPFEMGHYSAKAVQLYQLVETMGFCNFSFYFRAYPFTEMVEAAFGWKVTLDELILTGHRTQTLRQMFNAREGAIRHEINQRTLGNPPLEAGPLKGISLDLEVMAKGYYDGMGFESNGVPKAETLSKLGLEDLIADLDQCTGVPEPLENEYLNKEKK